MGILHTAEREFCQEDDLTQCENMFKDYWHIIVSVCLNLKTWYYLLPHPLRIGALEYSFYFTDLPFIPFAFVIRDTLYTEIN